MLDRLGGVVCSCVVDRRLRRELSCQAQTTVVTLTKRSQRYEAFLFGRERVNLRSRIHTLLWRVAFQLGAILFGIEATWGTFVTGAVIASRFRSTN
jgi:hypothetical protein